MLLEHDKWKDEDKDDCVAADFPEYSIDQRRKDVWRSQADRSYVGAEILMIVMLKWNASRHSCDEHW